MGAQLCGHSAVVARGYPEGRARYRGVTFPVWVCSPVPRLLFEDWTHEDFRHVLDSEDEIEELGKTMVQVAKVRPGTAWASSWPQRSSGLGRPPLGDTWLPAALQAPRGWGWRDT